MPDIQCTPRTRQSFTIRLEGGGVYLIPYAVTGTLLEGGGGCNSITVQQVVLLDDVVQLGVE